MDKKRIHNPNWKDNTRAARQKRRRDALNKIAQSRGWKNWSEYETSVINSQSQIQYQKDFLHQPAWRTPKPSM